VPQTGEMAQVPFQAALGSLALLASGSQNGLGVHAHLNSAGLPDLTGQALDIHGPLLGCPPFSAVQPGSSPFPWLAQQESSPFPWLAQQQLSLPVQAPPQLQPLLGSQQLAQFQDLPQQPTASSPSPEQPESSFVAGLRAAHNAMPPPHRRVPGAATGMLDPSQPSRVARGARQVRQPLAAVTNRRARQPLAAAGSKRKGAGELEDEAQVRPYSKSKAVSSSSHACRASLIKCHCVVHETKNTKLMFCLLLHTRCVLAGLKTVTPDEGCQVAVSVWMPMPCIHVHLLRSHRWKN
jgi:hypothetical protein